MQVKAGARDGWLPRLGLFLPSLGGGGAERVTLNLARGVVALGHPVDLLLATVSGPYLDEVAEGVRVVDLGGRRTMGALPALVRYLRREPPACLLSALNHANVVAIWAASIAGFRGRLLVAEHNELPPSSRGSRQRLFNASLRLSYPRATRVIAVSHGVKRSLVAHAGIEPERIEVIYNPVIGASIRSAEFARPSAMALDGVSNIVAVGRLTEQKNFPNLLRAFASLRSQRPARLTILGEGPDRAALQDLAEDLGVQEDVTLPGFVSNAYDYLAHADLFVLSSDWEGLPTVLIEALALGTRVVSTDCPSGPREILADGAYGALVPVGDSSALAGAMIAALDEPSRSVPESWLDQFAEGPAVHRYLEACAFVEPARATTSRAS